jgi:hypothetical protein
VTPPLERSDAPATIVRRRLGPRELASARESFARLYFPGFTPDERRRLGGVPALRGDDGLLPGPTLVELSASPHCRFDGYFDGAALVGAMISLDLGAVSLGDYLICDPARPDLVGLGGRMLRDWLAPGQGGRQLAVAEIAPLDEGLDAEEARIRRQRRSFFRRHGFRLLDDIPYALPGGAPKSLAVRPRGEWPAGAAQSWSGAQVAAIAAAVRATYAGPRRPARRVIAPAAPSTMAARQSNPSASTSANTSGTAASVTMAPTTASGSGI